MLFMKRPLEGNFTIISDKIMAAKRASRGLSTRTYESKGATTTVNRILFKKPVVPGNRNNTEKKKTTYQAMTVLIGWFHRPL